MRQSGRLLGAVLVSLRGRPVRRAPSVRVAGQGYELDELTELERIRTPRPTTAASCASALSGRESAVARRRSQAGAPRRRRRARQPGPGGDRRGHVGARRDVVEELAETIGTGDQQRRRVPRADARRSSGQLQLGAAEVEIINDSELVAKQLTGVYKVKHPAMQPLHAEAIAALRRFDRWSIGRCRGPRTRAPTRSSTRRWTSRRARGLTSASLWRRRSRHPHPRITFGL